MYSNNPSNQGFYEPSSQSIEKLRSTIEKLELSNKQLELANAQLKVRNTIHKSILVLDDEFDIVTILKQSLQKLGFTICTFTDPIVALEHFKSNFQDYRMVISDIRMPSMNGYEFVKKVKAIKPEVKVILMTSFEINDIEFSSVPPDMKIIDALLQKPFSLRALRNLMTESVLAR
jgi:two-component system cell cycle response regulator CpdR